jgi:hypothetical protein
MKKFILTAVAVLSLLATAVPVFAQALLTPAWHSQPVTFTSNYNGVIYQSTTAPVAMPGGLIFATTLLDTTAAIPVSSSYSRVAFANRSTFGTADTLPVLKLRVTCDSYTGVDTMKVRMQVSNDLATWTAVDSLKQFGDGWGAFATYADSGAVFGFSASALTKVPVITKAVHPQNAATGWTAYWACTGYDYVRFIFSRDLSSSTNGTYAGTPRFAATAQLYTADPDWSHR